jgi:DNA-binding MarR family transcriptional regulator
MPTETPIPQHALELANELRTALQHVFRRIRQEGDNDPSGLSLQHKLLLSTISQHPGIGVAELARLEKVRGPTMSGHIKSLEHAGLVRRSAPDPEDRRRSGLELSEQGVRLLAEVRERRRDWMARKLAQLPPDGVSALRQAISYLHELGDDE